MQRSQTLAVYTIIASALIASTLTAYAVMTSQRSVPGAGLVKAAGIGVYWNPQCTNATSFLDFGLLEPGESKSFDLYLKNEGNSALQLDMTSQNWNPGNSADYLTLTWNRQGYVVDPDEVITFSIQLSLSANVQGIDSFSFDAVISGTG